MEAAPAISVIMATYNGAALVGPTIESVLCQNFADFELIIVDDCSTDDTVSVVRRYTDPRVRVLSTGTNQGPVGARNQAFAATRGRFIAALDQDDLCLPTRFARQMAYLADHPDVVLAGTATQGLTGSRLSPDRHPADTTPDFLHFLLHVANPLVWSSVMFRADTARQLAPFERQDYLFAEDYDLYHRMSALGRIGRLDEVLTIYRRHPAGASRTHAARMSESATKVLAGAYEPWFGVAGRTYAALLITHIAAGLPVPDITTLGRIAAILTALRTAFLRDNDVTGPGRRLIDAEMSRLWWDLARTGIRSGIMTAAAITKYRPDFAVPDGLTASQRMASGLIGSLRGRAAALC
jgi:glycosyltransferase involved in cell wall biosynthesis